MDKQICRVCGLEFDFDAGGLGSVRNGEDFLVCGARCAKQAAEAAGNAYAIHDKTDAIVDTNV